MIYVDVGGIYMNKFIKAKIAVVILITYLGVFALSLVFGLLIGKSQTQGNTAYWVFKIICLSWLVINMLSLLIGKNFGKNIPVFFTSILVQAIPALLRIGFASKNEVSIVFIILAGVLLFLILVPTLIFGIGSDISKQAEDRAKPSSNHK